MDPLGSILPQLRFPMLSLTPDVASLVFATAMLSAGFVQLGRIDSAALLLKLRDSGISELESRWKGEIGPPEEDDPGSIQSRIEHAMYTRAPVFRQSIMSRDTDSNQDDASVRLDSDDIDLGQDDESVRLDSEDDALAKAIRTWEYRVAGIERAQAMLDDAMRLARRNKDWDLVLQLEGKRIRMGPWGEGWEQDAVPVRVRDETDIREDRLEDVWEADLLIDERDLPS